MAYQKKRIRIVVIFVLFLVYFLIAARPVPRETVLSQKWLCSLQDEARENGFSGRLLPFTLGGRFGYVDEAGQFIINRNLTDDIYLSGDMWTEYSAEPESIEIKKIYEDAVINIANPRGYPVLLDGRIFILGSEQNVLSEIGGDGKILWTYEFGAPLTCIDAADGLVLTGSIDGAVVILNSRGERVFYFEPGGSRYAVILGCAISANGSKIGIVSGIDQQRFLLLERFGSSGGEYKVVYHEFTGTGFRRPVRVLFIDEDRRLVFEVSNGIGCYNVKSRRTLFIPLNGEIAAIEETGGDGFLFLIASAPAQKKELVGVRFPQNGFVSLSGDSADASNAVFIRALFNSGDVFLGRSGSTLVAGGGSSLISFDLEEK